MHIANDCIPGKWGRGFVLAVSRRWKAPEEDYRIWSQGPGREVACRNGKWYGRYELGVARLVRVEDSPRVWVANMVAQHGVGAGKVNIDYPALKNCLMQVMLHCQTWEASVACPKIGSGLAGGDFHIIENMILEEIVNNGVNVTIYTLQ